MSELFFAISDGEAHLLIDGLPVQTIEIELELSDSDRAQRERDRELAEMMGDRYK